MVDEVIAGYPQRCGSDKCNYISRYSAQPLDLVDLVFPEVTGPMDRIRFLHTDTADISMHGVQLSTHLFNIR